MKHPLLLSLLLALTLLLAACGTPPAETKTAAPAGQTVTAEDPTAENSPASGVTLPSNTVDPAAIPEYTGAPYIVLNEGKPRFAKEELAGEAFESYASLDGLGRCGEAVARLGPELMPTEDRGSIGSVKPSGWQTVKYDHVDGKYLYNRCHLIGFQLSGENANEKNLVTGTRYLNVDGMLPFENMVADFIRETGEHVLYRVTPVFYGDELVCRGVAMEAMSVEDEGDSICFFVYCYNVQPDVDIDYATGESRLSATTLPSGEDRNGTFILNTNSKKIHKPTCSYAKSISDQNRRQHTGNIADLLKEGYEKAGCCF